MSLGLPQTPIDYDRLMREHLTRVFNERDASIRLKAIKEIYAADATLYESPDSSAQGHVDPDWSCDRSQRCRKNSLAVWTTERPRGCDRNGCDPFR